MAYTYYIGSMPCSSSLAHHGIKGMHWGVRRYQNPDGSYTDAGRRRYSRFFSKQDTYDRIRNIKNSGRMDYMSERQKKSLDKAEKYWKARVENKHPTERRGAIRRLNDRYRSYSLKGRVIQKSLLGTMALAGGTTYYAITDGPLSATVKAGQAAQNLVFSVGGSIAINEAYNRIFGHF